MAAHGETVSSTLRMARQWARSADDLPPRTKGFDKRLWFRDVRDADFGKAHVIAVAAILADAAWGDRIDAMTHARIAKRSGASVPSVKRALRELERAGLVVKFPRAGNSGGQAANAYMLTRARTASGSSQGPPGRSEGPAPPDQGELPRVDQGDLHKESSLKGRCAA